MISRIRDILNNAGFRRYAENTSWLFVGRIASLTASFFITAYIARYLGPERYGLLNYVTSFVGILSFVGSLGIDGILTRELVNNIHSRAALMTTGLYIKLAGSFIAITLVSLVSILARNNIHITIFIFLFSLTYLFQAFNVIDLYFQSSVKSRKTVSVQLISLLVVSALRLWFIHLGLGVGWFLLSYVIDSVIIASGLMFMYPYRYELTTATFDKSIAREILTSSWPLMISSAATLVYLKIDQVIIKYMMSDHAVGIYSSAVKLSEIWYFIPTIICVSVFPAIINARNTSNDVYKIRLKRLYAFMFYFSLIISLPVYLLAPFIISFLFGPAYASAAHILQIYMWAAIPVFMTAVAWQYLLAENYQIISLISASFGAVLNIVLNIAFIPRFGLPGAAIATLISYTAVPLSFIFFKKTRGHLLLIAQSILFQY